MDTSFLKNHSIPRNPCPIQIHDFHLVDSSPWPIVGAFSALMLTSGGVLTMHAYYPGTFILALGLILLLLTKICWWRDIIREATFEGQHTHTVQTGLKTGMFLFIVSEIMFFFAFFWAFFLLKFKCYSGNWCSLASCG